MCWCKPIADTPTTHIFKLPIGYIAHSNINLSESCENEWLCLKIAEAFGLPVAKSEILQLHERKIKMAMALTGKNNHYHWSNIRRDHFIETARQTDCSVKKAATILDDMLQQVDVVIEQVSGKLPKQFPAHISRPIFDGMRMMRDKLKS